jgi:hypothetical protein
VKKLLDSAVNMLTERLVWENKQRLFYRMRHEGLPRLNKPFPGAADGHLPLIDNSIRKLKPFDAGQLTSADRIYSFTSLVDQLEDMTDAAADYLTYQLTTQTDFIRKMRSVMDARRLHGRGILKATVNPMDGYKFVFEAVHPINIIMPQEAQGFEDADEFIHVRPMTVESYKRLDGRYATDPATVERIKGSKDFQSLGLWNQDIRLREGIAFTRQPKQLILFEHYTKTAGGWTVNTYCPMAPDVEIRKPYGVPYKVQGKVSIPFFTFQMEVKSDEGWYAPRGVAELLAPFEQYGTKVWNEKADAMTFANRPIYTGEKEIVNSSNYRWQPGEYIPGNIRGVQQGPPPISYDEEIMFTRQMGEEIAQVPDFGISQAGPSGNKSRTATENNRIGALQQTGTSDDAALFREDNTRLGRHLWGLICQFKERDFTFYAQGQIGKLPEQALHDKYLIVLDGAPDAWNTQLRFQKAMMAKQAFQGDPNVDQEYMTKKALQALDGRTALKGFAPSNLKGASEYEDEIIEINSLMAPGSGKPAFPAVVKPSEDHPSRIKALVDWLHAAGQMQTPVDDAGRQRIQQHLSEHVAMLEQQNPAAAKQIKQMLQSMEAPQPQAMPGMEQP